jgi:hypothetical protein
MMAWYIMKIKMTKQVIWYPETDFILMVKVVAELYI